MSLVIGSGRELHTLIDLYSIVYFKKLAFGLGSMNRPCVASLVYWYNGVLNCIVFHIEKSNAALTLSSTFNHCRQECMGIAEQGVLPCSAPAVVYSDLFG